MTKGKSLTLLFLVNDPEFFLSHRLPLGKAAVSAGYRVAVVTGPGEGVDRIREEGMIHHLLPLDSTGMNPLREMRALFSIGRLFRRLRPDVVHLVTIKPVLYGGIMARLAGVPAVVSAISGMGYIFSTERRGLVRRVVERLYRFALGHPNGRVIVQNTADRDALRAIGALRDGRDVLIRGSGVDLHQFAFMPLPDGQPIVVLPARMLWDKGVGEFVEAARLLRGRDVWARFVLAGADKSDNPNAIGKAQLEAWQQEGVIEWWGQQDDMPEVLARSALVVLPSYYREGLPKALIEALACGRAVVTTDEPGCRDVVEPGKNGLLVPSRDARALSDAIEFLLADRDRMAEMGRYGRGKAEREFDVSLVVDAHMAVYTELWSARSA